VSHRSRAPRTTRLVAGAAIAAALALTGCSATNPITTHRDYAASDGVMVDVGDLRLGNAMVLTSEQGAPGTLVGYVTNRGGEATEVWLRVADDSTDEGARFRVGAGETVLLGPDADETVEVSSVPAAPGAEVDVLVRTDRDGTATSAVPVLDGTLEEYADLVP